MKQRLFTPGPTPIPEEVALALSRPIIHHRQSPFKDIFQRASKNLKYLFQTKEDVLTLTASGTGAMEAGVTNLLSSGDSAIYLNAGRFGQRWGEVLRVYGVIPVEIKVEWGKALEPDTLREILRQNPRVKAVFLTHSETSTGTSIDLERLADAVRSSSEALIIVDGISSLGALEFRMDEWGLDVVLTASQKGLMLPPGLSFIALSQRAWQAVRTSKLPRFYFDLEKAQKVLQGGQTPWTPAISLIVGLDVSLQLIQGEGLLNVWARHERLARGLRQSSAAMGLKTFSTSPSNAVTALVMPERFDGEVLRTVLREKHGIIVAGGQDHLKGKVIRVAHLGYYDESDILTVITALGLALRECDELPWKGNSTRNEDRNHFDPTSGVEAALREFSKPTRQFPELRYP